MICFSALLLSLFITLALVPVFRRYAAKLHALDMPNERKVHSLPIPRTGGLAMATGTFVPVILWMPGSELVFPLLLGSGLLVLVGFWDDLKNLGFRAKFSAQIIAALIVIWGGGVQIRSLGMLLGEGRVLPEFIGIPLTLITIVGVTNAINLSDGLDGLAGGISLLSFLCLGFLGYQSGNMPATLISASICGAIFGFLRFNTFPASVFMGDAGSQLLGFLSISLALDITQNSLYSPLLPLVLLGYPVFDTVRVMLERMQRGFPPFVADRNHFHHKLLGLGFHHSESVLVIYLFHGALTILAYLLRYHSDWLLLGGYLAFSLSILALLFVAEKQEWLFHASQKSPSLLFKVKPAWLSPAAAVRWAFTGLAWVLIVLGGIYVVSPGIIPHWLGWGAVAAILAVTLSYWSDGRSLGILFRSIFYLFIPFLIYFAQFQNDSRFGGWPLQLSHLGSLLLGLLAVMVIKLTRRKGYQITPLDFLVLVIALFVPAFPVAQVDKYVLAVMTAKIVTFFFGFEIYLVEKRGNFAHLRLLFLVAMAVVAGRSFFQ